MITFVTLSILFVSWCIHFHFKNLRLYKLSWNVPGPLNLPFIGSAYLFIRNSAAITQKFTDLFTEYPDFAKIWLGKDLYYLVTKPEYLEKILNSSYALKKPQIFEFCKPGVGDGLIIAPVNIWKRHRRSIAPSLNTKILNQYPKTISEECLLLIQRLQKLNGKEIDQNVYITNCLVDITCSTLFGVRLDAQLSSFAYSQLLEELMEEAVFRVFRPLYHFDFIYRLTNHYTKFKALADTTHKITCDLIQKKIHQINSEPQKDDEKFKIVLDLITHKYLKNEWSREELENEAQGFLLAAVDTVAVTECFVLTMLGMHQEIQEKVYKESVDVLQSKDLVNLEDLSKLKYTERVIKETLRVIPVGPVTGRFIEEDINLGDFVIPKNSNIICSHLNLHRNEKYWPNPLKFDPDRFLPERSLGRHPFTWMSFSAGPRNCIGQRLGIMITKIMTAMIIRKFKVTSRMKNIEDIELKEDVLLRPKTGFKLTFEIRL